jgi:uncharacterized membrane protein
MANMMAQPLDVKNEDLELASFRACDRFSDSASDAREVEKLLEEYRDGDVEFRQTVNTVLLAFCGFTLPTLAKDD